MISRDIHILTNVELEEIKHKEYRRGRHNAFLDMAEENPRCHGSSDGDCSWELCPQLRDGEPVKSGRHCPIDIRVIEDAEVPEGEVLFRNADGKCVAKIINFGKE